MNDSDTDHRQGYINKVLNAAVVTSGDTFTNGPFDQKDDVSTFLNITEDELGKAIDWAKKEGCPASPQQMRAFVRHLQHVVQERQSSPDENK